MGQTATVSCSQARAAAVAAAPAVSVLMAVRNGERFIDEAIASLLAQTLTDLELILVDNGSSDGTAARVAEWSGRDRRVRPFRFDRPGLARSLNYAAAQARAPILARLDADDVAEPRRLEVQLAALAADPALGAVGSNAVLIDATGRRLGEVRRPSGRDVVRACLASGNPFIHSSVVMRRSAFERAGRYRDGLRVTEDLDLWIRLAEVSELDLIPELLVRYRLHGDSMTQRHGARMALAAACIRAAGAARLAGHSEPFRQGRPQLRNALRIVGTDREAFRRDIRIRLLRARIDGWYQRLPVPPGFKDGVRSLAVRAGLKPLYGWLLNQLGARPVRAVTS